VEEKNPMDMVGHDGKHIDRYVRKMIQYILPTFLDDRAQFIEAHNVSNNFTENASPRRGYEGEVISTALGIIISLEADGAAVMEGRGMFHNYRP